MLTGPSLTRTVPSNASPSNDVSVAPDGTCYCSDTGVDAQFAPTGTDAIWRIGTDGTVAPLLTGTPHAAALLGQGGEV